MIYDRIKKSHAHTPHTHTNKESPSLEDSFIAKISGGSKDSVECLEVCQTSSMVCFEKSS